MTTILIMSAQSSNVPTNQLVGESNNNPLSKRSMGDGGEKPSDSPSSTRRKPSARRQQRAAGGACSALSHSLCADRKTGIGATKGRLSVSFSDKKGLGAATIGNILSSFDDPDDDDKSLTEEDLLQPVPPVNDNRNKGGHNDSGILLNSSINRRLGLMSIRSQRSVTFDLEPKDLDSSESDKEE